MPSPVHRAERACALGFGHTRGSEHSPPLAPVRGKVPADALLQHLRVRQALLEGRFPPARSAL